MYGINPGTLRLLVLPVCIASAATMAAAPPRALFAFDNGLTRIQSLEDKARVLKELGYSGIGWRPDGRTADMLTALDHHGLEMVSTYVGVRVDGGYKSLSPKIIRELRVLKGRRTLVWLMLSRGKGGSDEIAQRIVRDVAALAEDLDLQVALYPHAGCHIATVEDAIRLAGAVDLPNIHISFNLCHFLKTDNEANLKTVLHGAAPRLRLVSVNGADSGDTRAMGWNRLIQPLGKGSFDTGKLLRLLDDVGYDGPIGLQCYAVPGDNRENLRRSMAGWNGLQTRGALPALFDQAREVHDGMSRLAFTQISALLPDASAEVRAAIEAECAALAQDTEATARSRLFACELLQRVATAAAVPALASLIPDDALSHAAVHALETADCAAADQALVNSLADLQDTLTVGVVTAIGNRRLQAAVGPLEARLQTIPTNAGDDPLRTAILKALGRIGSETAATALLGQLQTEPRSPVADALLVCAEQLTADGNTTAATRLCRRLWETPPTSLHRGAALRVLGMCAPTAAAEHMLEALAADSPAVSDAAVALARDLKTDASLQAAITALQTTDMHARTRRQLIVVLAERGDNAAAPAVRELAGGPDTPLAMAATAALERLGGPDDVPFLLRHILEGSPRSRTAAHVLRRMNGDSIAVRIRNALLAAPEDRQQSIARILVERNDPASLPLLVELMGHPNAAVVDWAVKGLNTCGGAAELTPLAKTLNRPDLPGKARTRLEKTLIGIAGRLPKEQAGAAIGPLTARGPAVRASRLRILAELGGADALKAIRTATTDPDKAVRDAAVRALCAWPDVTALEALLDVARTTDEMTHHVLALRACRRLLRTRHGLPFDELRTHFDAAADIARRDEEKRLFRLTVAEVRGLNVRSRNRYSVHTGALAPGATWTHDRDYTFTDVPAAILGATYIKGTMNDRTIGGAEPFMRFGLAESCIVYVAFDHRATALPPWLHDWEKTGHRLGNTARDSDLVVYKRAFPAGAVALGSPAAPGVYAMYVVAVVPAE